MFQPPILSDIKPLEYQLISNSKKKADLKRCKSLVRECKIIDIQVHFYISKKWINSMFNENYLMMQINPISASLLYMYINDLLGEQRAPVILSASSHNFKNSFSQ